VLACFTSLIPLSLFISLWSSLGILVEKSCFLLGASLLVAIKAVRKGAEAEGMSIWDYIWRGHDPTSVAVMTEVSNITTLHFFSPFSSITASYRFSFFHCNGYFSL